MTRRTALWVTGDGTRIPVCELSNRHLANIIRMMRRRAVQSRADAHEAVKAMLAFMDANAFGRVRFERADTRLAMHTDETFTIEMYAAEHPYASYEDLTAEARDRQIVSLFEERT